MLATFPKAYMYCWIVTPTEPELASLAEERVTSASAFTNRPPATQQSKVSFAEGTNFEREHTLHTSHGSRSHSQTSAFDENVLNVSQFVQVTESFLGDEPNNNMFTDLSTYVREGYVETEEERYQRMIKVQREAEVHKRKALLNSLFEMWDNDGSGYIELAEVEEALKKFKDGTEKQAVEMGKQELRRRSKHLDNRLMKREFRDFIHLCVQGMEGGDWFDMVVEYLVNGVERSYAERVRGEARKKWLQQIVLTGETSGASMEPVYKAVFQALNKDAETHGSGKLISCYVALLERNDSMDHAGPHKLRYVAATADHAQHVLGKELYKDMKGISFASIDSGKPIHVPRVSNHGNIMFWNTDRPSDDREGALIMIPLKDLHKRVFGLIGIDTLNDPASRSIFITHEIQFYQGVAKAFSIAYHHVDVRQKTMRISESAVSWVHRRCPHVTEIVVYMVEPDVNLTKPEQPGEDYVLRRMITTDHRGSATILANPPRLDRKDNLFRDYLFKCVDNSESVQADAYGQRHLAIPLRDDVGVAIVVIDISIGELKELPRTESREVLKMMKLLQTAYKEIMRQARQPDEDSLAENSAEILFDRLMLRELKGNVLRLDPKCYAELRSYNDPPDTIANIMRSVLALFYPEKALQGEFDGWSNCRQYITPELSQMVVEYDPTVNNVSETVPLEYVNKNLQEVPHGQVLKHGSVPAFFFYNWVFVCASLVEHMWKTRGVKRQGNEPPAADEADKEGDTAGEGAETQEAGEEESGEGDGGEQGGEGPAQGEEQQAAAE